MMRPSAISHGQIERPGAAPRSRRAGRAIDGRRRRGDGARAGDHRLRCRDAGAREHLSHCVLGLARHGHAACDAREVGVHLLRRPVALAGILGQRAHDDRVEVVRHIGPQLRRRRRHLREVLHRDLDRSLAGERDLAREHLVQHHTERVEIGARVDGRPACLLRREVLRRADDRAHLRHLGRAGPRDAEVRHLQPAVAADDDVVRLDVAVNDPVAVGERERAQDLARIVDRDRDRCRAVADEQLLERAPVEVLHRDVVGALGATAIEDRDDVRVVQPRGALRLAPEPLDELLIRRVSVVEQLQRDAAPELLILGEVHVGHPARAELALDHVALVENAVDQGVCGGHVRRASTSTLRGGSPPSVASRSGRRPSRRTRSAGAPARQRPRPADRRPARRR